MLWIALGLWTGFTLVGYFTPIRELGSNVLTSLTCSYALGPWETFWILFYGFATYGNAGYLREQVCLYMCPYARFQSAMFDKDTLIISYDEERGEPRAKGKKRQQENRVGDCIDCTLCVQVCPTGIDIREGLQYECIGCAACVDVCNQVMDKAGMEPGLIRYTTDHAMHHERSHIFRPRILLYATLLGSLFIAFIVAIAMRSPLAADILRDRGTLYRVVDAEHIENVYNFKIMNKSDSAQHYAISAEGIEGLDVDARQATPIGPGEVGNVPVIVTAPVSALNKPIQTLTFTISTSIRGEEHSIEESSRFFSPR